MDDAPQQPEPRRRRIAGPALFQQFAGAAIPYQFFLMLPYVPSIVAMIIMSRRAAYPKALPVPFRRGERISQIKMSMFENIQRGSDAFP